MDMHNSLDRLRAENICIMKRTLLKSSRVLDMQYVVNFKLIQSFVLGNVGNA